MTIYWHATGPLVTYTKNALNIHDLNPEQHIRWRVTRWEMFKAGWLCMWAAIRERHEVQGEQ